MGKTNAVRVKALADLSGVASSTGLPDRKIETVALKDVQPLTGYIRGGVTALACKNTNFATPSRLSTRRQSNRRHDFPGQSLSYLTCRMISTVCS
jgi:hypothetical protein